MSSQEQYLYKRTHAGVYRYRIERETNAFYFIKNGIKVRKKSLTAGTGFDVDCYELETEELVASYIGTCKEVKALKIIRELGHASRKEAAKLLPNLLEIEAIMRGSNKEEESNV